MLLFLLCGKDVSLDMATRGELISNIELLVTGGRPTDESRYWSGQALFMLNYHTALAIYEDAIQRMKLAGAERGFSWDPQLADRIDPSLLQTLELDVVEEETASGRKSWGKAILPEPPLPLPDTFGVVSVFVRNYRTGVPVVLIPSNTNKVRPSVGVLFSQPTWLRSGLTLELYGFRGKSFPDKVHVRMVGYGLPPEGISEEDFLNQTYPIPEHLIDIVTQRVVEQLRMQLGVPGDSFNDNKDQAVTPQPS